MLWIMLFNFRNISNTFSIISFKNYYRCCNRLVLYPGITRLVFRIFAVRNCLIQFFELFRKVLFVSNNSFFTKTLSKMFGFFFGWSYIYYLASPNFLRWIQIQHSELDTSRSDFQILRSCAVSPPCVYRPSRGIWCWQLFRFWRTSGDTTVWAGAVPPSGLDFLHTVRPINLQ